MERKESKLKLVGGKEKELKPVVWEKIYVCLYDDDNLVSVNNGAFGVAEMPTEFRLARFKEVALIDPNFIAFSTVGEVLVFEDMELIILDNKKVEMCDECIEEHGY